MGSCPEDQAPPARPALPCPALATFWGRERATCNGRCSTTGLASEAPAQTPHQGLSRSRAPAAALCAPAHACLELPEALSTGKPTPSRGRDSNFQQGRSFLGRAGSTERWAAAPCCRRAARGNAATVSPLSEAWFPDGSECRARLSLQVRRVWLLLW